MVDVFGTLGPACKNIEVLDDMFAQGMTGMRINLSHTLLFDCKDEIKKIHCAAEKHAITPKILIDMQGPELRIGELKEALILKENDRVSLGGTGIPVDKVVLKNLEIGTEVLLDDGKILLRVSEVNDGSAEAIILRGGTLFSRKSIALVGKEVRMPAMTETDLENLKVAKNLEIYGIMQPFVRSREDLMEVRDTLKKLGCDDIKVYAKIENITGVKNIESFIDLCDEVVIARGDLGNAIPLWELPKVQKQIADICNKHKKPFMVVTQMLSSMEHSMVPTRAEVSDIYRAVSEGAKSVMVTGETAVGEYPAEVIKYLRNTAETV